MIPTDQPFRNYRHAALDLALVQELLASATGKGDELGAVSFENQVVGEGAVADARISGHFTWWFETKTTRNGYETEGHDRTQLRSHARHLEADPDARLFVLTPDPVQPVWFTVLDGVAEAVHDRVAWLSFAGLAEVIRQILAEPTRLVSEQTRFLMTELVALYEEDGLLTSDDTVIVAARRAWGEYLTYGAYICRPDRSFQRGLTHFGFYSQGQIMDTVARIHDWQPSVMFTRENSDLLDTDRPALAQLITAVLDDGARDEGDAHAVMLLSRPDDPDTVRLTAPIVNDTVTAAGKPWGWTLGQRYTQIERLQDGVTRTSQL